jgi:alpha-1,6-mannosyltransferase
MDSFYTISYSLSTIHYQLKMKYTISIIFLICLVQINFFIQRHEFATLFATYAVFFWAYIFVLKKAVTDKDITFFIVIGLILRGLSVFSFPNLSDDIYRFLWDGQLINLGENPFSHTPQYYADNQLFNDRLTPELFSKLNSPTYFSVYPTVCQSVFTLATFLFPKSLYGAAIVIKLFLFACEAGTIFLMLKITANASFYRKNAPLIYALNPLIIIELVGNAHFEAAMIFFFILSIFLLKTTEEMISNHPLSKMQNFFLSATAFSLSVVSKILPLMFLPLFFKKLGWKRSFYFWIMVGGLTLIFCLPIYNTLIFNNIGKSMGLYFGNFEFNASIFYVLRAIGFWVYGYNIIHQITPFLTAFVLFFILRKSFFTSSPPPQYHPLFFNDCLFVISVYFACATTVHPWYAALPLACSVFTKWQFPVAWTFLIFLTYAGYTEGSSKHTENMPYLFIEYSIVYAFFIFEWFQKKPN